MLSYQHEYHAGNHADVLKHAVLALAISTLARKDKPLRLFDAHAGSGRYDLASREARRLAEHAGGIERVLAAADPPATLAPYLAAVRACNAGEKALRHYPGSPFIARHLLRPADHLVLMELHPRSLGALRRTFRGDRQVHIHERDCFEGLPAMLPPPERRGLVLIDPSYEVKDEFARVADLLHRCHGRWPGGVYLVWYPLIRDRESERFPVRIAELGIRRIYQVVLDVTGPAATGLHGSGLLVVNLPFGMEAELAGLMPRLHRTLAGNGGTWSAGWLVPE